MRLNIIFLFAFLFSVNAFADWVQDNVLLSVNTKIRTEIVQNLVFFPAALNGLNAENLASESKVTVQQLQGEILSYRWENDKNCTVSDPTKVEAIHCGTSAAIFTYADNPQETWLRLDSEMIIGTPCNKTIKKETSTKVKSTGANPTGKSGSPRLSSGR